MTANDFVTRASIWILTDVGFKPFVVSEQSNCLITRFHSEMQRKVLNENIRDLFCYNTGKTIMIVVLMENELEIFQFDVAKKTILLRTTFNQHYDSVTAVTSPIIKIDKRYYDTEKLEFVEFKHDYTGVAPPFAIVSEEQTYLFKEDNIIRVFPRSAFAVISNFNGEYQIFAIENVEQEYRSFSSSIEHSNHYILKAFGVFDYQLELTDVGDAVPEYFRVIHIIYTQKSIIYQILICFVVSEKCRLFSRYIVENATVNRHYLELHTNVRISRVFSQLLQENVFTVNRQMFVVNGLRQCEQVVALKDRIENVVFTKDEYFVFHGGACSAVNHKGEIVCSSNAFSGSLNAMHYQERLFVLFEGEIREYTNQLQQLSVIPAFKCSNFIVCEQGIFCFTKEENDLILWEIGENRNQTPQRLITLIGCAGSAFQYYQSLEVLILSGQPYSKVLYVPTIEYGVFAETILPDRLLTLDENCHLCAIERTEYGNGYQYLEAHSSGISREISILLRIIPIFDDEMDIEEEFSQLYDAYMVTGNFIRFLAINQFNFVTSQTKFNKSDFPEWLEEYYNSFDDQERIPVVTLSELFDSELLYVAPIYHLDELLFKSAEAEYKRSHDPNVVALYFIICGKNSLLANLYKIAELPKIADFLKRDFTESQNRQAAVRNAFTLVSQHKYNMAIGWFILGCDYFNAIKIAFLQEYFNSPIFALRLFELFVVNGEIAEEEINEYTSWFDSNLSISHCSITYFIDLFVTDQILKRCFLKKKTNYNRISQKMLSLLKQRICSKDIDIIVLFLLNANIYYENVQIAQAILNVVITLMLHFESACLRRVYQYMCEVLNIAPNDVLLNRIENERKVRFIEAKDFSIDEIEEKNGLDFSKLMRFEKVVSVFQYLYISEPEFKTYDNEQYIMHYLLRNYRCHVYKYKAETTMSIKQLVTLLFVFFLYYEMEAENEYFADPIQEMATIYVKIISDQSNSSVAISTFNELVVFIQNTWLSKAENLYFYNLLQNADENDKCLLQLAIEETVMHWKSQLKHDGIEAAFSEYLEEYSIESRINVLSVPELKLRAVEDIKIFSLKPLLILALSEKTLYVFDLVQHSNRFECLQIITCSGFCIFGRHLYTLASGQVELHMYDNAQRAFMREIGRTDTPLKSMSSTGPRSNAEKAPYCVASGSIVRFQQNGQFFVAMTSISAQLTFLQQDNDNSYVVSHQFGKIIDFAVYNLHVYVILEENKRSCIYSFAISDIMCRRVRMRSVSSGYPKATQLIAYDGTEGQRFALLQNGSVTSVDATFEREYFATQIGAIQHSFVNRNRNFCCADVSLCVIGREKRNICLNCGEIHSGSRDTLACESDCRVDIYWGDNK